VLESISQENVQLESEIKIIWSKLIKQNKDIFIFILNFEVLIGSEKFGSDSG